ncbi:MAG: phosphoglycerate kinase [Natronospirillum sp.]
MSVIKMSDLDLAGKTVLIRQDLNVPLDGAGNITSDQRITASVPTIQLALQKGATVMVTSHLGRPTEGEYDEKASLAPVAKRLGELLGRDVPLIKDWVDGVDLGGHDLVLLDNVRFNEGEGKNNDALAQKMAKLCDVFVMDAFGTAHRAQASTHGVAKYAPVAAAGPLLAAELEALGKALHNPERPMVAVVGGAKVSSKLTVLEALSEKCDVMIVGGGISNTFVASAGFNVGNSLHEKDLIPEAKRLREKTEYVFAEDCRTTTLGFNDWSDSAPVTVKELSEVVDGDEIIDYGPKTVAKVAKILQDAKTIIWNGPCGVFEFKPFAQGTEDIARAIANSDAFSIAGGGDTLAAIDKFGLADKISYISTGGGAFLEFVEGKTLPAVAILEERAAKG